MGIDGIAALIISMIIIFILIRFEFHVSIATFIGALILALFSIGYNKIPFVFLNTILNMQTWRLIIIILLAIGLSIAMDKEGLLRKLAETLEKIGSRVALFAAPTLIGLVPMPAGALVSASMVKDVAKRLGLNPEETTFLNYWFRHVMEYSWPIYQGIILTGVILSVSIGEIVKSLFFMTVANAGIGLAIGHFFFKKQAVNKNNKTSTAAFSAKSFFREFINASWPILLIIILVIVFEIDISLSFAISLAMLIAIRRINRRELVEILKKTFSLKIMFLPVAIIFYKTVVEHADIAFLLFNTLFQYRIPEYIITIILPFIAGFATGTSLAFVGIAFPLLIPIIGHGSINVGALILAYVSGMAGLLLSPMHLCLILSVDYFKANLYRTYKYVLPAVVSSEVIALIAYFTYNYFFYT